MSDGVRFFIGIVVTYIIAIIMSFWPTNGSMSLFSSIIFLVFCGWCISWIFALISVVMGTSGSVQGISSILTFPVIFVSDAFVPIDTMPKPYKF